MKKSLSTTSHCCQSLLLTSFLLATLLVSSSAGFGNFSHVGQSEGLREATSFRSAAALSRVYALTNFQSQRTASDSSKQNRVKHPVTPAGLVPGKLGAPNGAARWRVIIAGQSLFYLSIRFSRPAGRAPPPSA
jgi:hypothetical protein